MRAAKALADKGVTPPGVDAEHQKIRSCSIVLPPDVAFKDGAKEALTLPSPAWRRPRCNSASDSLEPPAGADCDGVTPYTTFTRYVVVVIFL